jgi:hypothetical protein
MPVIAWWICGGIAAAIGIGGCSTGILIEKAIDEVIPTKETKQKIQWWLYTIFGLSIVLLTFAAIRIVNEWGHK